MEYKELSKKLYAKIIRILPLTLTVIVFILLLSTLLCKLCNSNDFLAIILENKPNIVTISGLLSGFIIAFLTAKVLQIRQEKINEKSNWNEITQKLHKYRKIINKLLLSQLWSEGTKHDIDTKYKGLTIFDVREISFFNSKPTKQAREFVRDTNKSSLAELYLELKSFIFEQYTIDESLYSEFEVMLYYDIITLQKWNEHHCGNGLYYFFDYKYSTYKNEFNWDGITSENKDEIIEIALDIDRERYKNLTFGPELLSKLGTQLIDEVLPKLTKTQEFIESDLPHIVKKLFLISGITIVFGILLPIVNGIYTISPILDIISISTILSVCFFLVISFYGFMKREIKIQTLS